MSQPEHLKSQLYNFAAHIRDPDNEPAPEDIEDRRLGIYRNLFFNNVDSFLSSTFPVLKSLYDEQSWQELARSFYTQHRCQSPYFLEISREFLDYLQSGHVQRDVDPPFLFELAHYEWVELALSISQEEVSLTNIDTECSLLAGHPVISPLAWLLTYSYPVHRISPEFQPRQAAGQPTCIIVYRDEHDEVQFKEINTVTARLLQQLETEAKATGEELLVEIAGELGYADPGQIVKAGSDILQELKSCGIILGTAVD
jgi:hypothetical protein